MGDVISSDGKNDENLKERKNKAWGKVSQILAIIAEIPFGKYDVEAALLMRNSMFINGILTNIEDDQIESLELIDEYLLRKILKTGSKSPKESLYLECGVTPIRYIVKSRRLNYLYHLLTRNKTELIAKVYNALKDKPINDDWYRSVCSNR